MKKIFKGMLCFLLIALLITSGVSVFADTQNDNADAAKMTTEQNAAIPAKAADKSADKANSGVTAKDADSIKATETATTKVDATIETEAVTEEQTKAAAEAVDKAVKETVEAAK